MQCPGKARLNRSAARMRRLPVQVLRGQGRKLSVLSHDAVSPFLHNLTLAPTLHHHDFA